MYCRYCEGTGKLGMQRETCSFCGGSGYEYKKMLLNKDDIERGLNELINEQIELERKLENSTADTEFDCLQRIELIHNKERNEVILDKFFGISYDDYRMKGFGGVKIEEEGRIKLTYTDEMRFQDALWENEKENVQRMKELYKDIMQEAVEKGFKGSYVIYEGIGGNEAIIDVYMNDEEKKAVELGKEESTMFGYCKPLIEYLEEILNEL